MNTLATVGIVMGSSTDLPVMKCAAEVLTELGVPFEMTVVSAHRTPERLFQYGRTAESRGITVLIAGAGGAAHLPGMIASVSVLPVIGVPVKSKNLDGLDSLLSIVQMPKGVPVATVAIDGGRNAGILAAQIVAITDSSLRARLHELKSRSREDALRMAQEVEAAAAQIRTNGGT